MFLGDVLGAGRHNRETVDALLTFRRWVLSYSPFVHPDDFVVLRGAQEEMLRKLLQVQFAAEPLEILQWMQERGVTGIVESYGGRFDDGIAAARVGLLALSKWTAQLRLSIRETPGHAAFAAMLKHAAVTADQAILLVNAGLDPDRRLAEQRDHFWWNTGGVERIERPYPEARLVVRGADPQRRGIVQKPYWVSLDGGCGEDGALNAFCFSAQGEILERVSC